jgi:hypothetical protein
MGNNPGQFAVPAGESWLAQKIQGIERQLTELRAANVFGLTGIRPLDGGTDLDGFVNINGPLDVNGDAEINGPMEVNGDSTFNGAMSITGALNLPAGIIGNDALANPSTPVASHADAAAFSITTGANVEKLRATITVPAGFTKAAVYGTATMSVFNNSGSLDSCYLAFRVNGGQIGWSNQVGAPASQRVLSVASGSGIITGLSGGTIYVSADASTGVNAWSVDNNNTINIDALVTFYR